MQTYVHLAVGVLIAEVFFPNEPIAQAGVVLGSGLPDVPTAIIFAVDKLKGRAPFSDMNWAKIQIIGAFHSLLCAAVYLLYLPIGIGYYSHLIADVISHKDEQYRKTDPGWLWPLPIRIPGLFEYRKGHGVLFSPIEILLSLVCFTAAIAVHFWRNFGS